MGEPARKRRLERYPCHLPASIRKDGKTHPAEVLDLSEGGARIRCSVAVVHIGDRVEIAIRSKAPFAVMAQVAFAEPLAYSIDSEGDNDDNEVTKWSDTASGVFGVKFVSLDEDAKARLTSLMRAVQPR